MLTFKHYGKSKLAKVCLDYKLYVNGWVLKKQLEYIHYLGCRNEYSFRKIILIVAFVNSEPIGCIVKGYITLIYVKPANRRQGIGTSLFKELDKLLVSKNRVVKHRVALGSTGSKRFFTKTSNLSKLKIIR